MWLGRYDPIESKSLSDVPEQVRLKVLDHLRKRLGPFADRLKFTGVRIVDFDRLAHDEPSSKDYHYEVYAYDLQFEFQMRSVGIDSYTAQIKLRSDGSILQEIDLPAFAESPEKLGFISLEHAASIASSKGYEHKALYPQIVYLEETDSLAWKFQEKIPDDGLVTQSKVIFVSAHNGEVLLKGTSSSITIGDRASSCKFHLPKAAKRPGLTQALARRITFASQRPFHMWSEPSSQSNCRASVRRLAWH
ncbi:hypothetical protein GCM10010080_30750 [Thermomonas carbonis]|nr:hypothetical protein GCM10010080_30750 [Thermomonas carbonis]